MNHSSFLYTIIILFIIISSMFKVTKSYQRSNIKYDLCDLEACKCIEGKINCNCAFTSIRKIEINKESQQNTTLPQKVSIIQIENCDQLIINQYSLRQLKALQHIDLVNIKSIIVDTYGLQWDEDSIYYIDSEPYQRGISIHIADSNIQINDFAFKGSISMMKFNNVNFETIKSYAFTNLKNIEKIHISDSMFHNIETQAFKKFNLDKLIIENTKFLSPLPSRTFFELTINKELKLFNIYFDYMNSLSFMFYINNNVKIENCYFKLIEGDAFHLSVKGNVFIEDNYFDEIRDGAFYGISSRNKYEDSELIFENNTINMFELNSFKFNNTNIKLRINDIISHNKCTCTNKEMINVDKILCEYNNKLIKNSIYNEHSCKQSSPTNINMFVLIIIIIILIIISIICIYIYKKTTYYEYCYKFLNIEQPKRKLRKPKIMKNGIKPTIVVLPYNNDDNINYKDSEYHTILEKLQPIQPIENEMYKLKPIQTDM